VLPHVADTTADELLMLYRRESAIERECGGQVLGEPGLPGRALTCPDGFELETSENKRNYIQIRTVPAVPTI
jgi:hypothetical protein